jgi:hypothetical protein
MADFGGGKRLTEQVHASFPLFVPNHGQAFDMAEMPDVELNVFPDCIRLPTIKSPHFKDNPDKAVLLDQPIDDARKVEVVLFCEFAAGMKGNYMIIQFLMLFNSHGNVSF